MSGTQKLSSVKSTIGILRYCHHSASTNKSNLALFAKINELASAGKWDNINNKPKILLFGNERKEAEAAFEKLNSQSKSILDKKAYGKQIKFVMQFVKFAVGVFVICKSYELIVPEKYRLKIKYAEKHHDEHH
ncbi:Hypothetical protein SRAE_1000254500 [Strongyloides ratti]|uniref:Uncharacterized protein n=1 Tax=Strongyloides ratti TaxID=34506 RepID=A0A090L9X1_STRRB|nr:Hypothetical protein SRAE_1000254500 [Strongyloides ratti]CEF64290.1 Hypothetical protein SRAE_1000254500 [Strongyloides ratti]